MDKIRLHLKNDIMDLEKMIGELEKISTLWGIPMKDTMNINLLLEEIISNIIFYAYDDDQEHSIILTFEKDENIIRISIEDDGKPFNILDAKKADIKEKTIDERKIGGLGIHFVRHFSDNISYKRKAGKNILTILKIIHE